MITIGEKLERDGASSLFVAIGELAEAHKRLPVGEWDSGLFQTDPRYRVKINGGPHDLWLSIPRFHAVVEVDTWPVAIVNPAGGSIGMGADEDSLIRAVQRETAHIVKGAP